MSVTYPDYSFTSFPDSIDTFDRFTDITVTTYPLAQQYYALYNGVFIQVKKFKELPDVLSEKKDEITQYIKANNLSGKTDDDYSSVFNYYNGLK